MLLLFIARFTPQVISSLIAIGMLTVKLFLPPMLFGTAFITTTEIGDLVSALQKMHLPRAVVIPFAVTVRFFSTAKEEFSCIFDAMRVRGIERLLEQNIFKLSGGEKQIIAFASVFALSPDIFVLDEPSSNLDTAAIAELSRLLEKLKAIGKAILVLEHRLYYPNGIADRIVLLEDGEITQEWTGDAFGALRQEQREALGLRAFNWLPRAQGPQSPALSAPILQVENLCTGYGKSKEVLRQVSLSVAAVEIVGIVGQNGEGKTALARVLCGLHKENDGTVQIGGSAMSAKKRHGKIYLVMQDLSYQLFTESVEEELRLSITDEAAPDEETLDRTLRTLSLAELASRHPQSLSGEQKQHTSIAVAAVGRAPVLIFNKPTSGLDFANTQSVVEIIKRLAAEGQAILIITHDDELLNLAFSRVVRMKIATLTAIAYILGSPKINFLERTIGNIISITETQTQLRAIMICTGFIPQAFCYINRKRPFIVFCYLNFPVIALAHKARCNFPEQRIKQWYAFKLFH